ncbi:MAG: DNA polymerase III subunit beta [Gammaproteobacteria bacterium]|nr:MAG: DNA polymerase III subunit beta [Gammaproteobacteria bacterium]PIE37337.1 MAG: DNA polymerase III subunit beta [Gammaproteobacteria bacterium]
MKFSAQRDDLLHPLQQVIGAVERRQTNPIMGNVLINAGENGFSLTATDSEIEIRAEQALIIDQPGATTVPARKFHDIIKSLPDGANVTFESSAAKALVKSGRSRFTLATLPAENFPHVDALVDPQKVRLPVEQLLRCIKATAFSMAQQDVRFFLNGMLLEISSERLSCVATDGHRLAHCQVATEASPDEPVRAIIPRKSVLELQRMLDTRDAESELELLLTSRQLQVRAGDVQLTTRLIDGRFPDYNRVIPMDSNKEVVVDCHSLRNCLARASILSNEKYRGIRLALETGLLKVSSHNPEQEEAEDELEVEYQGESVEIGFNVNYLIDVLSTLETENAVIRLKDSASSALISPDGSVDSRYVVMPMRL